MKDNGPDKIPSRALKECTPQMSPYLTVIFNQSLTEQFINDRNNNRNVEFDEK